MAELIDAIAGDLSGTDELTPTLSDLQDRLEFVGNAALRSPPDANIYMKLP